MLTLNNIQEYDNFRFVPVKKLIYGCMLDGFPKLIKSGLPESISGVGYEINVSVLHDYLVREEAF